MDYKSFPRYKTDFKTNWFLCEARYETDNIKELGINLDKSEICNPTIKQLEGWSSKTTIGLESLSYEEDISELEKQFLEYVQNWKNETRHFSTMLHIVNNNNFFDIISIGKPAIKFILEDIKIEPTFLLFIALEHLVKVHLNETEIVPKEIIGNVTKTREIWLNWGKQKKLIK